MLLKIDQENFDNMTEGCDVKYPIPFVLGRDKAVFSQICDAVVPDSLIMGIKDGQANLIDEFLAEHFNSQIMFVQLLSGKIIAYIEHDGYYDGGGNDEPIPIKVVGYDGMGGKSSTVNKEDAIAVINTSIQVHGYCNIKVNNSIGLLKAVKTEDDNVYLIGAKKFCNTLLISDVVVVMEVGRYGPTLRLVARKVFETSVWDNEKFCSVDRGTHAKTLSSKNYEILVNRFRNGGYRSCILLQEELDRMIYLMTSVNGQSYLVTKVGDDLTFQSGFMVDELCKQLQGKVWSK